jgi:hypothetical protein
VIGDRSSAIAILGGNGPRRSTPTVKKALYKSTIIIWTEYDPSALEVELTDLAHQVEEWDAYCSTMDCVLVADPAKDPDWDGTEFFDAEDDEDVGDQCTSR